MITDPATLPCPPIRSEAWHHEMGLGVPHPGRSRVVHEALIDDGPWGGVPLGGLGSGSIGRTTRGDFARWHLDIGSHSFESVPACQFSVYASTSGQGGQAHALSAIRPATLTSWNWDLPEGAGRYHGLFPNAWYEYEWSTLPIRLTQRQFSPVIPGNYRETSYPVGLFEWFVENPGSEPVKVGIMFSWQNLVGRAAGQDRRGGHRNLTMRSEGARGVLLRGPDDAAGESWNGSFVIAAEEQPGLVLSTCNRFDADDGADLWADFLLDGELEGADVPSPSAPGEAIGAAIAATFTLEPGASRTIPFVLSWDFPIAAFGSGRQWVRRYARYFEHATTPAWAIACEGLARRAAWSAAIDDWQAPILADPHTPEWYKAALFNELYFMVDGGTFWADRQVGSARSEEIGPFALIECFDYPFYNTLDVYFYASFALTLNWPELTIRIVRDFIATVPVDDPEIVPVYATGGRTARKVAGAVPHDVGGPPEDPFVKLNHYHLRDVNGWKDLNSKFVLLVWQAAQVPGAADLAEEGWPAVMTALRHLSAFDRDGDGLPEHDGVPDQTYDTWPMLGASAYGGSLWMAALRAGIAMGERVGDADSVAWLEDLLLRGRDSFEAKLWAGTSYRYDAGGGPSSDSIMADQLAGQWWADATRLGPIVPNDHVARSLQTIFEQNVLGFRDGNMGAVNGMRPDGTVDESSEQSQEVWVGTTYALAAFMLHRGMTEQAWVTAAGVERVVEERGYRFRTPEAYDSEGNFRATLYLRPLAIWAIENALRAGRA